MYTYPSHTFGYSRPVYYPSAHRRCYPSSYTAPHTTARQPHTRGPVSPVVPAAETLQAAARGAPVRGAVPGLRELAAIERRVGELVEEFAGGGGERPTERDLRVFGDMLTREVIRCDGVVASGEELRAARKRLVRGILAMQERADAVLQRILAEAAGSGGNGSEEPLEVMSEGEAMDADGAPNEGHRVPVVDGSGELVEPRVDGTEAEDNMEEYYEDDQGEDEDADGVPREGVPVVDVSEELTEPHAEGPEEEANMEESSDLDQGHDKNTDAALTEQEDAGEADRCSHAVGSSDAESNHSGRTEVCEAPIDQSGADAASPTTAPKQDHAEPDVSATPLAGPKVRRVDIRTSGAPDEDHWAHGRRRCVPVHRPRYAVYPPMTRSMTFWMADRPIYRCHSVAIPARFFAR